MPMKLYVGGLSYDTNESTLEELFAKHGNVASVNIIKDRGSGMSKGFGFVEMDEAADAQKAIKDINGKQLDGRTITVNQARPQQARTSGPR